MKYLYWTLPMATVIAYGVWRYYAVQVYVGDLPPFDLHFYSFREAQTYLAGLTPSAKAIYLGPLHLADSLLMFCLAATLVLPIWRWDWPWLLPAMLYVLLDLVENGKVAGLLRGGLCMTADVENVALVTSFKFTALVIAAILAVWGLWRMRRVSG
ncbi:MAG: hypothetical protein ABIR04_12515 [Cypionkella sp.]